MLLEPLRDGLPSEVFGEAFALPPSDGRGRDRKLLGEARAADGGGGLKADGTMLRNVAGQPFTLEILVDDESFVRIYSPWVENMKAIGLTPRSASSNSPSTRRGRRNSTST